MPTDQVQLDVFDACRKQAFFFVCDFAPGSTATGMVMHSTIAFEVVQIRQAMGPFWKHG